MNLFNASLFDVLLYTFVVTKWPCVCVTVGISWAFCRQVCVHCRAFKSCC